MDDYVLYMLLLFFIVNHQGTLFCNVVVRRIYVVYSSFYLPFIVLIIIVY